MRPRNYCGGKMVFRSCAVSSSALSLFLSLSLSLSPAAGLHAAHISIHNTSVKAHSYFFAQGVRGIKANVMCSSCIVMQVSPILGLLASAPHPTPPTPFRVDLLRQRPLSIRHHLPWLLHPRLPCKEHLLNGLHLLNGKLEVLKP